MRCARPASRHYARRKRKKLTPPPADLTAVLSVQEAAALFDRHPDTIMYHIDQGNLLWRKIGPERRGMYLIWLPSLLELYGQPANSPSSVVQFSA